MRLTAVLLARSIALFDVAELDPRGSLFFPDLVPLLVGRFRFQTFPIAREDFDQSKGISFSEGFINGITVENLTIFQDGVKVDTKTSTEEAQRLIIETFEWLSSENRIKFPDLEEIRWSYVSNIIFESRLDLDRVNPSLSALADSLETELGGSGVDRRFHTTGLTLDVDRTLSNPALTAFTIQRRAKTLFSANRFFSAAPLRTDRHIAVLERFERNL